MTENYIDYGLLIDEAMHIIVKKVLQRIEKQGLPGDHHFYITFITTYPGVMIGDKLKKRYPDEMTIVLQHQFWDLEVENDRFGVTLSFENVRENLTVPFSALTAFADPSVKFGLQFRHETVRPIQDQSAVEAKNLKGKTSASQAKKGRGKATKSSPAAGNNNVVSIDAFRKKGED